MLRFTLQQLILVPWSLKSQQLIQKSNLGRELRENPKVKFTKFNDKTKKSFVKVEKTKLEVAFHYRCQNYGIYVQTATHRRVLALTCTGGFRLYSVLFLKSYL